jgi:hypothetical protein
LRVKPLGLTPGVRLNDTVENLSFLDSRPVDFPIGIKELDKANFGATAKELLLYIAPKGTGKSWFGVHMGKQGLLHRAKVLHISLEMAQERIVGRYYQSLFSVASRNAPYMKTSFEYDELKRLLGWETVRKKPKISFQDTDIRRILREKMKPWGLRLGSIVIKDFPSGSLTMSAFNSYLDYLGSMEKFYPTLVIVDYPDLMKQDVSNLRISTGRTFVDLRGSASERNYALIAPTQGGRSSIGAKRVRSSNVSEDITKVMTADNVLTYSQTEAEKRANLARLFVNNARGVADGYEVVISQAYSVGQYALESAMMSSAYWEQMGSGDEQE